jgi:hypothetical protein
MRGLAEQAVEGRLAGARQLTVRLVLVRVQDPTVLRPLEVGVAVEPTDQVMDAPAAEVVVRRVTAC